MLATFAELYRQEIGAEEDVHRTLPFFGTALGLVIAALAYAAGHLPKWTDLTTNRATIVFSASAILLCLAIIEAAFVLFFVSKAIARREYRRIGVIPPRSQLDLGPRCDHCYIHSRQTGLSPEGASMNVPPSARPTRKPSGAVTYRQSQGANVWPGTASSDKAFVRVLGDGLVIFQEFLGDDKVAVSVGGQDRVLTRAEWGALPIFEG